MVLLSYTVVPYMVEMITATKQQQVIDTATLYLRVDTLLYFIPAVICILRNAMQGIGDSVTPVVSSSFELICKVLVATFLTPVLGYWAIIWAEPIAWVIMVMPLLIGIKKNPVINGWSKYIRLLNVFARSYLLYKIHRPFFPISSTAPVRFRTVSVVCARRRGIFAHLARSFEVNVSGRL